MHFSNIFDNMVKLLTGLKLFKTSGSSCLDLTTGVNIANLMTVGKNLLLKNHLKQHLNWVGAQEEAL